MRYARSEIVGPQLLKSQSGCYLCPSAKLASPLYAMHGSGRLQRFPLRLMNCELTMIMTMTMTMHTMQQLNSSFEAFIL